MTDQQVKTLGGYILGAAPIIAIALSPPFSETVTIISYLLLAIAVFALLLFFFVADAFEDRELDGARSKRARRHH